jgi:hypothetical protein
LYQLRQQLLSVDHSQFLESDRVDVNIEESRCQCHEPSDGESFCPKSKGQNLKRVKTVTNGSETNSVKSVELLGSRQLELC